MKQLKYLLSRDNPLLHYVHHFLIANAGLYLAYVLYGSITPWEVILYFFFAFIPVFDEFMYVVIHYLDSTTCRLITNLFIGSEYKELLTQLHDKRKLFTQLILHNLFVYFALVALLYVFLMLDVSLGYYGIFGLIVHLGQDIFNDEYEFQSVRRWIWPAQLVLRGSL